MPTLDFLTGFNPQTASAYSGSGGGVTFGAGQSAAEGAATFTTDIFQIGPSSTTALVEVVYLKYATLPNASIDVLGVYNTGANGVAAVGYDVVSGKFCFMTQNSSGTITTSINPGGPVVATGIWYRVELSIDASANPWVVNAQIATADGTATALTQTTTAVASSTISGSSFRRYIAARGLNVTSPATVGQITATDWACSATLADYPIGPVTVRGYSPNAVGTHNLDASTSAFFFKEVSAVDTALTTAETTSYQTIDDVPLDQDVDAIWVGTTTGAPATPTVRAAGTMVFTASNVSTPSTLTPVKNAATVNGDLMVLITTSRSITATCATPAGWTIVTGAPWRSATASGGSIYMFTRIADGIANDAPSVVWSGLTTGTSGDSCTAHILSVLNLTATQDSTPTTVDTSAFAATLTLPSTITGTNNSLVISAGLKVLDSATQTFTLATETIAGQGATASGTGQGVASGTLVKATAGASGTATLTDSVTTSSRGFGVTISLKASLSVVQPTATWYAEYNFADEATLTSAPLAVRALAAQNLDSAVASTWAAKLFDSVQGTNTEDVSNSSISTVSKVYVGKTFAQRPNTGGVWTLAALNGLSLRFGLTAAASGHPRIEAAMVEAAYTVTAGNTYTKTGAGIAPFTGGGTKDQAIVNSSGKGISPLTGGGADAFTDIDTGAGVSPFTGSGADVDITSDTGTGIAPFTGGGTGSVTGTKTGAGVGPFTGSGASQAIYSKTGSGVAPFTGSGASVAIESKIGTGISPFTGGGADVDLPSETGAGVAQFTGGGSKTVTHTNTGAGIAPFTGSGASATTYAETGAGVSPFTGSGADAPVYTEAGAGISPFTGGGSDEDVFSETGASIAPFTGGGASQRTVVKSGIGIAPFTGSGADVDLFAEAGTGIAPFTGGGSETVVSGGTNSKAGVGIAPFTGSGADVPIFSETGAGIAPFTGSGADVDVASETGIGISPFSGSGSRAMLFTKTGAGVSVFTGTGDSTDAFVRTGSGISPFTGSGADVDIYADTAAGISPFTGSGADEDVFSETGTGISPFTGAGAKALVYTKTGVAVSDFNVAGTRTTALTKSGVGVAPFTGSGADIPIRSRTGAGVIGFTGSGFSTRAQETVKSGAAIAVFTGGGAKTKEITDTGSGVAPLTGSGADVSISAESGSGIISVTGGGIQQYTRVASGRGVSAFSGGGTYQILFLRAGTGTIEFAGGGSLNAATAPLTDFTAIIISGANSRATVNAGKNRVTVEKDDTEVISNG